MFFSASRCVFFIVLIAVLVSCGGGNSGSDNTPEPVGVLDGDGVSDDVDTDNDGVADTDDAFPLDPAESIDTDNDGIGNNADTDDDSDGVNDVLDQCPNTPIDETVDENGCASGLDTDRDGASNEIEIQAGTDPNDANSVPLDTDRDGLFDVVDDDRDGDGVDNVNDYFPDDAASSSVPTVQITSPNTLITVGSSPMSIEGTVSDPNAVIVVNGIEVAQNSGIFNANVALKEGANAIIVRAIDINPATIFFV